jgi:hypothetical protein
MKHMRSLSYGLNKTPRSMKHLLCSIASLASVIVFGTMLGSAQTVDAICTPSLDNLGNLGNQISLMFTPGLKLGQHPTTLTGSGSVSCQYQNGTTHVANIPTISGGGNLSCLVNTNTSGTVQFDWNDNNPNPTSMFTWNSLQVSGLNLPSVPRVFILSGTVTSGRFFGDNLVISYNDIPNLNYLHCLTTGLTQVSGPATATFTQSRH